MEKLNLAETSHINEVKWIPLKELHKNPKNTNKHPKDQIERLAKIIEYQGWRWPIIADENNMIVAGEGRYLAAQKLKLKKVPVSYQEFLDADQMRAFVTSDNAIASWADLDLSLINQELGDFDPSFDIDLLGLKNFTIDVAEKEFNTDEDEVPENVETRCKEGDLWILGEHRLLCGDSTNIQHVERLMGGEKADMVFTDPPYGVDYHGSHIGLYRKGDNSNISKPRIKNDKTTDIYKDLFAILKTFCNGPGYIFCGAGKERDVLNSMHESSVELISTLIWRKDNGSTALNANYKPVFELFYYVLFAGKRLWDGDHCQWTVWDIKRNKKNEFHPTQKPIEICEKAIKNHKAPKVLDLFGGSGSTLIACEKTNRKCYMMELDPHYCDVIIERWEKFTGKKAALDGQEKE